MDSTNSAYGMPAHEYSSGNDDSYSTDPSVQYIHAFAREVKSMWAPTAMYERLKDKTPEHCEKHTEVSINVATHRNNITWFVMDEAPKISSQAFRDEIYTCASNAHATLERGCAQYYRGTNAVHTIQSHSDAAEAVYHHNHYTLGGPNGSDVEAGKFPDDVRPDEFRQHLITFAKFDAQMHTGTPRFLDEIGAEKIANQFEESYHNKDGKNSNYKIETRKYTDEDIAELKKNQGLAQPCKPSNSPPSVNISSIGSEMAEERQPPEYARSEYRHVKKYKAEKDAYIDSINKEEKK